MNRPLHMSAGCLLLSLSLNLGCGTETEVEVVLPVTPIELVAGAFETAEGIVFNGEGRLYVVADSDVWEIDTDGTPTMVADLVRPVGLAARGASEILVGEFGPLAFNVDGENTDGSVVSLTPAGEVSTVTTGIGDPNFIHVRADGSLLVSDDFTDIIYAVSPSGELTTFLQGIQSPNGIVESLDGSELYVAQTFSQVDPSFVFDDRVWRVPLNPEGPGTPELLASLGGSGANDGVTLDALGRLYVAANVDGEVWRIDPATNEVVLVAENMPFVASLAFGEGEFNRTSIYATQLFGGVVWELPVGVAGAGRAR
ncbi:MAG: SMP-30/gluconolactonase/LRE family protein [Polyangiales bacterium]